MVSQMGMFYVTVRPCLTYVVSWCGFLCMLCSSIQTLVSWFLTGNRIRSISAMHWGSDSMYPISSLVGLRLFLCGVHTHKSSSGEPQRTLSWKMLKSSSYVGRVSYRSHFKVINTYLLKDSKQPPKEQENVISLLFYGYSGYYLAPLCFKVSKASP